jgi:acyl carrier protein
MSQMVSAEIADGVRAILAKVLERSVDDISLDASLADELGLDSLTAIETSIAVERRFGVTMPEFATPDDLGLVTVRDLVRLTEDKVRERTGGAS